MRFTKKEKEEREKNRLSKSYLDILAKKKSRELYQEAEKKAFTSGAEKRGSILGLGGHYGTGPEDKFVEGSSKYLLKKQREYVPELKILPQDSTYGSGKVSTDIDPHTAATGSALTIKGGQKLAEEFGKSAAKKGVEEGTKAAATETVKAGATEAGKAAATTGAGAAGASGAALGAGPMAALSIAGAMAGNAIQSSDQGSSTAQVGGGALSGAATGASIGAMFGGVGAAPGAIAGAVIGGAMNIGKAKRHRKRVAAQIESDRLQAESAILGQKGARIQNALQNLGQGLSRALLSNRAVRLS